MQNKALLAIGKWDLVTSVIMLLTNVRLDADKRTEPMKKLIWASLPMFLLMMMIGCAGTLGPHDFGFVEPGVFASKDSNRFYPNIQVKIGRFTGKNEDLRFQEIEEGNLVQLLENVPKQLNSTFLTKKIDFKGLQRIEKGEYPVAAIREMLLNALVHKNYMGSTIQLRVYDNCLSIWNEGNLPEGLSFEALKLTHSSLPRNPIIADVCFKAGYIDSWGRGTLKIFNSCKEAELPEPKIQPLNGGVLVTLYKDYLNPEQLKMMGLNERQVNAVVFVKENNSISNSEYQTLNDIGKTTATLELKKLVDLNLFTPPTAKGRGAKYKLQ